MHSTKDDAFWSKVDRSGECWVWTGYRLKSGYGSLHIRPRRLLAHRYSWELANGPIPAGQYVCHTCDNPPCVRPDHLFLGTSHDNHADMLAKGRGATGDRNGSRRKPHRLPHGEAHWATPLTADDVRAIRRRYAAGEYGKDLAVEYGVGRTAISHIVNRIVWRHVE